MLSSAAVPVGPRREGLPGFACASAFFPSALSLAYWADEADAEGEVVPQGQRRLLGTLALVLSPVSRGTSSSSIYVISFYGASRDVRSRYSSDGTGRAMRGGEYFQYSIPTAG